MQNGIDWTQSDLRRLSLQTEKELRKCKVDRLLRMEHTSWVVRENVLVGYLEHFAKKMKYKRKRYHLFKSLSVRLRRMRLNHMQDFCRL